MLIGSILLKKFLIFSKKNESIKAREVSSSGGYKLERAIVDYREGYIFYLLSYKSVGIAFITLHLNHKPSDELISVLKKRGNELEGGWLEILKLGTRKDAFRGAGNTILMMVLQDIKKNYRERNIWLQVVADKGFEDHLVNFYRGAGFQVLEFDNNYFAYLYIPKH